MNFAANSIAVTGAAGQLGCELCRLMGDRAVPLSRQQCDLADPPGMLRTLAELRPAVVINAAAYTAVDRAETEPESAKRINANAVGHLADYCQTAGARLVQISTDYVFGGDTARTTPYREDDRCAPVSVYGQTKLWGEQQAARAPHHLIVRTCGLYGPVTSPKHTNFVATMLKLAGQRGHLRIVNDQYCTPSYVPHVAAAIVQLIEAQATGIIHVVNEGATTWYEFAQEIFRLRGIKIKLEPITSAAYAAPARRPGYSVLATEKMASITGHKLPTWQNALAEFLCSRLTS